jgi:Na+(H+)/acetate symporter ActP
MDFIPEDITPCKPSQTDWDQIVATRQFKDLATTTWGAVAGLAFGVVSSIGLILVSPTFMGIDQPNVSGAARHLIQTKAWFPLENPGILSIPPVVPWRICGDSVGRRTNGYCQVQ